MTAILGIDPGGTTGLCLVRPRRGVYSWKPPVAYCATPWQLSKSELYPIDLVALVRRLTSVQEDGKLFVACEDFVLGRASTRGQRAGGQHARDLIGAVKTLPNPFVLRSAAQVKPWATPKRFGAAFHASKFRGLPHAADAARHALYAAVHDLGWPDPLSISVDPSEDDE
jgi:hypothetical protein